MHTKHMYVGYIAIENYIAIASESPCSSLLKPVKVILCFTWNDSVVSDMVSHCCMSFEYFPPVCRHIKMFDHTAHVMSRE